MNTSGSQAKQDIAPKLLDFWRFYHSRAPAVARAALSVRDLLAWVGFINTSAPQLGLVPAYVHGAYLILLDGIGLGLGMPPQVWNNGCTPVALLCQGVDVSSFEAVTRKVTVLHGSACSGSKQ